MIVQALLHNAETASLAASSSARGHYLDGLSLFAYLRGNPLRGADPFGRYDVYDQLEDEWYGYRIAALEQIRIGAEFATMGAKFALSIGGGLLGFDLYNSIKNIWDGNGSWMDYLDAAMTLMPAAKILGKALTATVRASARAIRSGASVAVKTVARAERRFQIADRLKRWFKRGGKVCKRLDVMCFAAGTHVLMADGSTKLIEEVAVGERVWAVDTETGEVTAEAVADTFSRHADETIEIEIDEAIFEVTPEHPFWVVGEGMVEAELLDVGDRVVVSDDATLPIRSLARRSGIVRVHNLDVWENHTYFASASGDGPFVLVHNCTPNPFKTLLGLTSKKIKAGMPKHWKKLSVDRGRGVKWVDENGFERMRIMAPNRNSKFIHGRSGYVRWTDQGGDYLDQYGNVVSQSDPLFDQLTHIILTAQ